MQSKKYTYEICLEMEKNNTETIGFFKGFEAKKIGPKVLSNFFESPITLTFKEKELRFTCVEHLFMWLKAYTFKDQKIMDKLEKTPYNPTVYKRLGRSVTPYNDDVWTNVREKYMYKCCKAKFKQNEELKKYLLSTGNSILVECNDKDYFWGAGISLNHHSIKPSDWKGSNKLGLLLMDLREELK